MKPKRKKSAWDLFAYGRNTPKEEHPRAHCWTIKPIKVHITKKKPGIYTKVLPKTAEL
jgi:hypothetical protein